MPFSIGKVTVDVSLCGAVPQGHHCLAPVRVSGGFTPCPSKHQTLSDISSCELNSLRNCLPGKIACLSLPNLNTQTDSTPVRGRSKNSPTAVVARSDQLPLTPIVLDTVTIQETGFPQGLSQYSSNMPCRPASSMLEPPLWAVPARGDSRLEPVCEAIGSHSTVDLTNRPFLRIGRSPNSDVQLLHQTSSRRHALIFHHPNGSCYVVDSGSSHGTYVNGVRVRSTPSSGMVIPHRVRRGSLIRFGGPGAPSFVLKSLSVGFSAMVKEVDEPAPIPNIVPVRTRDSIFRVNTRMNVLTGGVEGGILKKRSFDDVISLEPDAKRQRCVSPTPEQQEPIQIVSPDSPRKSRRVTFHDKPQAFYPVLVTDELSSDEEEVKS
jgi:pSer/pThr/pTyr-binding forkhead associated (FHA) protein